MSSVFNAKDAREAEEADVTAMMTRREMHISRK